jgi:tetratricopeptide (TPR) repeat protein
VPIDRAATLRNAEKLLRQGKLDAAIGEYLRVVEDQPRDWNTANLLGDLYVRAGQIEKAVEQFTRIADSLNEEGFLPKAAALYKKILKTKPDHEHALIQSAEIASSQGLLADARGHLNVVLERRRSRGDQRGVAQIRIRLGSLDPTDFEVRSDAARARAEIGDRAGALRDLKEIATELAEKGDKTGAIEALRTAAELDPDDAEVREQLLAGYVAAGDLSRAREFASTADQFKSLAAAFEGQGLTDDALAALREAARLAPEDVDLRTHLARTFAARGDLAGAAEYLTVETAGNDPQLLMTVAEIKLRAGSAAEVDSGMAILDRLLNEELQRREAIAGVGLSVAESAPEAGFRVVEKVADTAIAESDWPFAAAVVQEFVARVPGHIQALMRLVEISVDGGLEGTMYKAQAALADAYLAAGSADEARVIAEDLVAREPWERANIDRFRRALVLLGESEPDAVIADRLSGVSPFTSADVNAGDLPSDEIAAPEVPPATASSPMAPNPPPEPKPHARPVRLAHSAEDVGQFELSPNAIDLVNVLGDLRQPSVEGTAPPQQNLQNPKASSQDAMQGENVEIDLSIVLDDIKTAGASSSVKPSRAGSTPIEAGDLNGVFEHLRDEAARKAAIETAQEHLTRGLAFRNAGRIEESIDALKVASRAPMLRFQAASTLGRLYRDRGSITDAIEWLERAVQAPAPTPDEGHQLLYELAGLLESSGEVARALAICLELRAEAGDYRDIVTRIERLAKT